MSESNIRLLHIMQILPRYEKSMSVEEVFNRLRARRQEVTVRTVQRDLRRLCDAPELNIIQIRTGGRGNEGIRYCYSEEASTIGPRLEPHTALALLMSKPYLARMLPEGAAEAVLPLMNQAERSLQDRRDVRFADYHNKIRTLPRYLSFGAPKVDSQIQDQVSTALLNDRCLEITYKEDPDPFVVRPLALIDRGLETILFGYADKRQDYRQYMLHRIGSAKVLDRGVKRPKGFDLDEIIESGYFAVPVQNVAAGRIKLRIRLKPRLDGAAAWLDLAGTPLSEDQAIKVAKDGMSAEVSATLHDTWEFRSWLMGLGAQVEVVAPKYLKQYMRDTLKAMMEAHSQAR